MHQPEQSGAQRITAIVVPGHPGPPLEFGQHQGTCRGSDIAILASSADVRPSGESDSAPSTSITRPVGGDLAGLAPGGGTVDEPIAAFLPSVRNTNKFIPNIRRTMYKVGVWGPGSMGVIALRGVIDHPNCNWWTSSCTATPRPVATRASCAVSPRSALEQPRTPPQCWPVTPTWWSMPRRQTCGRRRRSRTWCRSFAPVRTSCHVRWSRWSSRTAVDAAFTEPLREAAIAGGVSFFTTGIDSGFANDVLPLALTGVPRASSPSG